MAIDLLSAVLTDQTNTEADASGAGIRILQRGAIVSSGALEGHWLVFRNDEGALTAEPAALHSDRETRTVALLIEIPEARL